MKRVVDVVILGSGFAGSLIGSLLQQAGRSTVVLDRARHPRFAIGESSTPAAGMVLSALARDYSLPWLEPFAHYGSWQRTNPQIPCGLKRGFAYFQHQADREYELQAEHANELLVAASRSNELGDTHWFRAAVDARLAEQRRDQDSLLENFQVERLQRRQQWSVLGRRAGVPMEVRADFLIDASGGGQVLASHLQIPNRVDRMLTHSRACYSHFRGVGRWRTLLQCSDASSLADHPFDCDDAALHHLLGNGWMWMLRFNHGITSCGWAWDPRLPRPDSAARRDRKREASHTADGSEQASDDALWNSLLDTYPSIQQQFADCELAAEPGGLVHTARLQRWAAQAVGEGWAMLPHTAGFVDPLHSTGIAHALGGVEALARILVEHWQRDSLEKALAQYQQRLDREFAMIDQLVSGCYRALSNFRLFVASSMLYFAGATSFERQRHAGQSPELLCANDPTWSAVVRRLQSELSGLYADGPPSERAVDSYLDALRAAIAPYNHVGLLEPSRPNMYHYTVAPHGGSLG